MTTREELLQALLELCHAVGQHPDSMFADGPLHAPFVKATEVVVKASPPLLKLVNPIEGLRDYRPAVWLAIA